MRRLQEVVAVTVDDIPPRIVQTLHL